MNFYPYGAEVKLKFSGYPGIITAICIRGLQVEYEIAYYETGAYKRNWFCQTEFDPNNPGMVSIGFQGANA